MSWITGALGPQTRRYNTRSGILPSVNDSILDPGPTGREFRFRGKPKQEEVKGDDLGNNVCEYGTSTGTWSHKQIKTISSFEEDGGRGI
jgi:hypothetical protein